MIPQNLCRIEGCLPKPAWHLTGTLYQRHQMWRNFKIGHGVHAHVTHARCRSSSQHAYLLPPAGRCAMSCCNHVSGLVSLLGHTHTSVCWSKRISCLLKYAIHVCFSITSASTTSTLIMETQIRSLGLCFECLVPDAP